MKNAIKLGVCVVLMLVSVYLIYYHYEYQVTDSRNDMPFIISGSSDDSLSVLKEKYNNNEIVMTIDIPGVVSMPIVQTEDNAYYLNHNLYRKTDEAGTPYLDYRIKSINDKKIIIYGHNGIYNSLEFNNIVQYQDESFYKDHPVIFLNSNEGKRKYLIFSSFIDDKNFDYETLNTFNNSNYDKQLDLLKSKSLYDTGVEVSNNSHIIILLTGTLSEKKDNLKYQFVVATEEIAQKN